MNSVTQPAISVSSTAHDAAVNAAWARYVDSLRHVNRLRAQGVLRPWEAEPRALLAAETCAARLYARVLRLESKRLGARMGGGS